VTPIVRRYRPGDRAAVLQIAADTGFFGAPVEAFLDDRRLMQEIFVVYYVDREPEHLWVADQDGAVVGYVCGSVGDRSATLAQARVSAVAVLKLLALRCRIGPVTRRYFRCLAGAVLRGEYPHPDLSDYPAHLHINLAEAARGLGLGKRLMNACLDQMTRLGVPGIHLKTTSLNTAAVRMYEKMGFVMLAQRRTRLWESWLPGTEVINLVYGKRLVARQDPAPRSST
jgi:ribosomal protein S18 acetylase RimI-like enzyme